MSPRLALAFLATLLVPALGCTGGGHAAGDADASAGGPDGGSGDCAPCLEKPASGFQLVDVGTMIDPQQDVEYCEVVRLPGDPSTTYYVNRFESKMTSGSHHLIVNAIVPGSATEMSAHVGDRTTCFGPGGFGGDLTPLTGSQLPYYDQPFPAGVGRTYQGGQLVVFDYHYLNTTDKPIRARAAVNFHTTTKDQIQHIARDFGMINLGINVPKNSTQALTTSCTFDHDLMVFKLSRHTHRWGTDFPVYKVGGADDGTLIYTSPNYENPDYSYAEPTLIKAGEGYRFTCNYFNDSPNVLTFGEKTSNEMCILFGTYYAADDANIPDQGCFKSN